jgi:PIN domain nuclease of toxin-antitoxin system
LINPALPDITTASLLLHHSPGHDLLVVETIHRKCSVVVVDDHMERQRSSGARTIGARVTSMM